MYVWKDIFRPGRYCDKAGNWHEFTNDDVRSAYANAVGMWSKGQAVPTIWEHDWSSVPILLSTITNDLAYDRDRRANHARNTFGWAEGYELRTEGSKPVLWAKVKVPDQADANQWKKTRYCSPRIDYDLTDSMGRTWAGCSISHIAATNSPVQMDQKPVFLGTKPSTKTVFLGGTIMDLKRLRLALESWNIMIPESVSTPEEFMIALETAAANSSDADPMISPGDDEMDDDMDGISNENDDTPTGAASTAMLSNLPIEARNVVLGAQRAQQQAVNIHRRSLIERFDKVEARAVESGIATPKKIGDLKRRLTGVNLSFNEGGELLINSAIRELETVEAAVKAVAGRTGGKKKGNRSNIAGVDLSSITFGGPRSTKANPLPGTPEFEEQVKALAKSTGDRITGRPS